MRRKFQLVAAVVAGSAALAGVAGAASSPAVVTGGTSSRTNTSAVLKGTVNPNGSSTTYFFQWGLTTSYGASSKPRSAGHGTKAVSVRAAAGGLTPGTTYHYRVVATNQFGTTAGRDRAFRTTGHPPPGVVTGPPTQLSSSGATLTGSVNPSGGTTTYWFEYGTSTNYTVETTHQRLVSTTGVQTVMTPLQGLLAPGTVYHYRLVASHGGPAATTFGADAVLMTYPSVRPYAQVHARTRPKTARHRPYVLTTTGSIGPASIPPQWGCHGNVTIRFFRGLRQVKFTLAGVQPNCTFSAQSVWSHVSRPPAHLHVVIRFVSTPYLAGNRAPYERITLG